MSTVQQAIKSCHHAKILLSETWLQVRKLQTVSASEFMFEVSTRDIALF